MTTGVRTALTAAAAAAVLAAAAADAAAQATVAATRLAREGGALKVRDPDDAVQQLALSQVIEAGQTKLVVRELGGTPLVAEQGAGCEIREESKVAVCTLPTRVEADAGKGADEVKADSLGTDAVRIGLLLNGGQGDDELSGGAAADSISGAGGDDTIDGGGGDDSLLGSVGADHLAGGTGIDTVNYDDGRTERVVVTVGDNKFNDGSSVDQNAAGARDNVTGATERVIGTPEDDLLTGDEGADILEGRGGGDTLDGGAGADSLAGQTGDDTHRGGDGNDTLDGGFGRDLLAGDAGDDTLLGSGGRDGFQGGPGIDTASYGDHNQAPRPAGVTVRLANGQADDGNELDRDGSQLGGLPSGGQDEVGSDIERLLGTEVDQESLDGTNDLPDDTIIGSAAADELATFGGDDTLTGGAGADALDAGAGDDRIFARDGVIDRSIACGDGVDVVEADPDDPVAADCEQVDRAQAGGDGGGGGGADGGAGGGGDAGGALDPGAVTPTAVEILSRSVRASRTGDARILVRCRGAAARCSGSLRLTAARAARARGLRLRRGQVLGSARVSFWIDRRSAITVRLSRAARAFLGAGGRIAARATLAVADESAAGADARGATVTRTIRIEGPRRRARR